MDAVFAKLQEMSRINKKKVLKYLILDFMRDDIRLSVYYTNTQTRRHA
jgi:hypothetical protein